MDFKVRIVVPPMQRKFTEEDVASLDVGRRQLRSEWPSTLKKPATAGEDWPLLLPFENSYRNAFEVMCETVAFPHVAASGRLCLYLKNIDFDSGPPQGVYDWIATVGKFVAIKDHLALSFALDYERQGGNPGNRQTKVAAMRSAAKPYGEAEATATHAAAAEKLAAEMVAFLREMTC